jgi:hypothetical protein
LRSVPFSAGYIIDIAEFEFATGTEDLWLDDRRAPVAAPGLGGLLIHRDIEVSFE